MSNLIAIANSKLGIAAEERVRALPSQIEAIKSEHSAKGLARSGATLKRVRETCITHIREHGTAVTSEYKWVINQSLLASQTWSEQLAASVPDQFDYLINEVQKRLVEVCAFTGTPHLAGRLIDAVKAELDLAVERSQLEIRGAFAEKSRGLVRSIPGAAVNLVFKIVRGGS